MLVLCTVKEGLHRANPEPWPRCRSSYKAILATESSWLPLAIGAFGFEDRVVFG